MRKIRVAHLTSVHDPGDTRITYRECASLATAGYDVVLVARDAQRPMPPGVRLHCVTPPRNRLQRFTSMMWAVYRAAVQESAELYHFHDPELIPVAVALRVRGRPVIFDVHEDIPSDIATKPWIWQPLRPLVACLAGALLAGVRWAFTGVVAATPAIARRYRHPRLAVVQNYPESAELVTDAPVPYDERPRHALYVGQITRLRGAAEMVEAIASAQLPHETRLVLVGEFEDEALYEQLRRLRGWTRVVECGYRRRDELPAILAGARLGLLLLQPAPNHEESLPTKLLEYMAAGLPVVTSAALLRCREIVERCDCGLLVDPGNVAEIAGAIRELLLHPQSAREMGERGRCAVGERYNWAAESPKLLALYARSLSER